MSNEKMREEFEAWVIRQNVCVKYGAKPIQCRDGSYKDYRINDRWNSWKAARSAPNGYCSVPNETIKKAYALASSVCGDCYAGEDTEILFANQLANEISKSDYWMNVK